MTLLKFSVFLWAFICACCVCGANADIRLANGTDSLSGRLEIYDPTGYRQWFPVCDSDFTQQDADVVCRMIGNDTNTFFNATIEYGSYYGTGSSYHTFRNFDCGGYEEDILECHGFYLYYRNTCGNVGITCTPAMRLVNGSSKYSGRVELYYGGEWNTLCDAHFTQQKAYVICNMMTNVTVKDATIHTGAYHGSGSSYNIIHNFDCNGYKDSIFDCGSFSTNDRYDSHCSHNHDVGVNCRDSEIRLVNGYHDNPYAGRVEVFYHGQWGSICDDDFDVDDAVVICKMLGMYSESRPVSAYQSAHYGQSNGPIQVDDLQCTGNETDISDCQSNVWKHNDCSHSEDASVDCGAPVRLVNGTNHLNGRVEVYHEGEWMTVCSTYFSQQEADVVCNTLTNVTHSNATIFTWGHFGQGSSHNIINDFHCNGYEDDITECYGFQSRYEYSGYCRHNRDVGISCNTQLRLVGGTNSLNGRVEVYHQGEWMTVCSTYFSQREADVVCRMSSNGTDVNATILTGGHFGQGSSHNIINNFHCNGYEDDITECYGFQSRYEYSGYCRHNRDVGIRCSTQIRMINDRDSNPYAGRVEVFYNGQWGSVCDDSFDRDDAYVICKMLGMDYGWSNVHPYQSAHYGQGTGPIQIDDLNCDGTEDDIGICRSLLWTQNNCGHSEDASVNCYDIGTTNRTTYYTRQLSTRQFTTPVYWHTSYTTRPWWSTSRRPNTTPWYWHTTQGYRLEDLVTVNCNENGWDVTLDFYRLRQMYPGAVANDIYLGENSCTGVDNGWTLRFTQGLRECLTSEIFRNNELMYNNELVYAMHDPQHPYIIRHYNWTIGIECDVQRNETSSGHLHHDSASHSGPSVSGSSHYNVSMAFYKDQNFIHPIQGNPLHVAIGSQVYVKVYNVAADWTIKMRVHSCYTKPTPDAPDHLRYDLIKNGCEVDDNTHIISQSAHETKFVFSDFEYTTNHEGIYIYCDAIFCGSNDYSRQCLQTCNPVVRAVKPSALRAVKPSALSTALGIEQDVDVTVETAVERDDWVTADTSLERDDNKSDGGN